MTDLLESILCDSGRARLIKFFYLNPQEKVTAEDLKKRLLLNKRRVTKELKNLFKAGIIKKRIIKSKPHFFVNRDCVFYNELKGIVSKCTVFPQLKSLEKLPKIGHIKLILVSGIFANNMKARADLLVVGDNIREQRFTDLIKEIEAEIGKEIRYTQLSEEEYKYRLDMFDKFTKDFFETPHKVIFNQIGELPQE